MTFLVPLLAVANALEPACSVAWTTWEEPVMVAASEIGVRIEHGSSFTLLREPTDQCTAEIPGEAGYLAANRVFEVDTAARGVRVSTLVGDQWMTGPQVDGVLGADDAEVIALHGGATHDGVLVVSRLPVITGPIANGVVVDVLTYDGSAWSDPVRFTPGAGLTFVRAGGAWVWTNPALYQIGPDSVTAIAPPSELEDRQDVKDAALSPRWLVLRDGGAGTSHLHTWEWANGWIDGGGLPLPASIGNTPASAVAVGTNAAVASFLVPDPDSSSPDTGSAELQRSVLVVWRRHTDGWSHTDTWISPRSGDGLAGNANRLALHDRTLVASAASAGVVAATDAGAPVSMVVFSLPPIDEDGDGLTEDQDPDDTDPTVPNVDTDGETDSDTDEVAEPDTDTQTTDGAEQPACGCVASAHFFPPWILVVPAVAGVRRRGRMGALGARAGGTVGRGCGPAAPHAP